MTFDQVPPGVVLVRADGSPLIGTGHVMRCLALAQAWKRSGGEVVFAHAESTSALECRLQCEGMSISRIDAPPGSAADAAHTIEQARTLNASWIVADGYHFGWAWQKQVKQAGFRLLLLDDYGHAEQYAADLVLNQNLHADPRLYTHRDQDTHLLLGTRYVLLRREFLEWRNRERVVQPVAHKLLVSLGGADPDNVTAKVVHALRALDVEARVVVGGSNPHFGELSSAVNSPSSVLRDATNMPELMAWADVAVAAGGTTSWELAFMGLPSLMVVLAENQVDVAAGLASRGVVLNLGLHRQVDAEKIASPLRALLADAPTREQMSQRGRAMVDGLGADRVITLMRGAQLTLRRAHQEDSKRVWEWANDPEVRAVSFNPELIPWADHVSWYARKLGDPHCYIYIGFTSGSCAIGQVRFDLEDREGVMSVSVAPGGRGKGYGSALIAQSARRFIAESGAGLIHAYIKPENLASLRAFEKAGFERAGATEIKGQPARHFILRNDFP